MLGQWCEPPLVCELFELVVLGVVVVVLVEVPLLVCVEPAALAIAAPPPTAAPVITSAVSMAVVRRRIGIHLLSLTRRTIEHRGRKAVGGR
jgi:hypothetical protein